MPAARSFSATVASCGAGWPTRASEPAVVCMRSPVSMLSLSSTGMPSSGAGLARCLGTLRVALARDLQGIGVDLEDGIDAGSGLVELGDARDVGTRQLFGRHRAVAHALLLRGDRRIHVHGRGRGTG